MKIHKIVLLNESMRKCKPEGILLGGYCSYLKTYLGKKAGSYSGCLGFIPPEWGGRNSFSGYYFCHGDWFSDNAIGERVSVSELNF